MERKSSRPSQAVTFCENTSSIEERTDEAVNSCSESVASQTSANVQHGSSQLSISSMFVRHKDLISDLVRKSPNLSGSELAFLRKLEEHAGDQVPKPRSDVLGPIVIALNKAEAEVESVTGHQQLNRTRRTFNGGPLSFSENQSSSDLSITETGIQFDIDADSEAPRERGLIRSDQIRLPR